MNKKYPTNSDSSEGKNFVVTPLLADFESEVKLCKSLAFTAWVLTPTFEPTGQSLVTKPRLKLTF